MREQLESLSLRLEELETQLAQPETYADPRRLADLTRERKRLEPIVARHRAWMEVCHELAGLEPLLADPECRELARAEYEPLKERRDCLEQELRLLLLPKDPLDGKDVVMEIRAGVGGEEAALFAAALYRMYAMYCERQGWRLELADLSDTELGGIREVSFLVSGDDAYGRLKYESGVHRVQRVPETESGGRIHTSTCTVAVLPEVDEVELALDPSDIEMQVYRASGAGGQHVNKTSSAVRLIHRPTGTVAECQQERSQFQNREKAMQILRSRLFEAKQREQDDQVSAQRRSQVGTGMRNERIRTYNFPQGRVTDHRIGLTLYRLDAVLDGELDEIVEALALHDQMETQKRSGS